MKKTGKTRRTRAVQTVKTYFLDACAMLAIANKERGADAVQELIHQAETGEAGIYINIVNFLEIYYKLIQQKGADSAEAFIKSVLYASPINIVDTISLNVFREAARFKITYKVSLADSIALAGAFCSNSALVTADHHELDAVDQAGYVRFLWIR